MRPSPRFSYRFPSGWPGAGLLIVRLAAAAGSALPAIHVLRAAADPIPPPWLLLAGALTAVAASLLLSIGLLSPYAELALTIAAAAVGWRASAALDSLTPVASCPMVIVICGVTLGLAFVGPGAYSIDAKLTGRHEVTIPPNHANHAS